MTDITREALKLQHLLRVDESLVYAQCLSVFKAHEKKRVYQITSIYSYFFSLIFPTLERHLIMVIPVLF